MADQLDGVDFALAAFREEGADAWFVEDERVFGPLRDPYHRVEVVETSRPVRVTAGGLVPPRRTLERIYEKLCEALAEGEAMDLAHGASFYPTATVRASPAPTSWTAPASRAATQKPLSRVFDSSHDST